MGGAITLERRLANFRAALPRAEGGPLDGRAEPARAMPPRLAERLAGALGGEVVATTTGTFVRAPGITTVLPVDRRRLAALPGQPPPDVPLICLDTETTGLGTATGTYAFLVGLGWWEGEAFRQVQLLLPDQSDEPALLSELAALIPPEAWLVTYNGRGFDWPLLVTRYRMARRPPPLHAGHLDLLPLVRRVFRHRMADARLRSVEETLLGVARHRDVEGWEIPGRYLDFLRGGPADVLVDVARHNSEDVLSLARLIGHVETLFGDGPSRRRAHPGDLAGLAAAYSQERRDIEALDCLEAALEGPPRERRRLASWTELLTTRADAAFDVRDPRAAPEARVDRDRLIVDRARLLRRLGRHGDALEAWQDLADGGGPFAATAWVEVAKNLEHRRRDASGALAAARAAQQIAERARFIGRPMPRLESELALRTHRLHRRVRVQAAIAAPRQRTSGSLASVSIDGHASRTPSRSGSNEHAIVLRSPASALR